MRVEQQSTDGLLAELSRLEVDWRDDQSERAINQLKSFPVKANYTIEDVQRLLKEDFETGKLIARLFLGLSKDSFEAAMVGLLGRGQAGVTRFRKDPEGYLAGLAQLDLVNTIESTVNRELVWHDVLIERMRSGRGSAISGQKRGRFVEDFVEEIVQRVFGTQYDSRCNFSGQRGKEAKCDFAIPSKEQPLIVVEAKGYDATGSKMTDVIGDIEKIIAAKRPDTAFMLFTDGTSWVQRRSDFVKIVDYQNHGDITRIYTQKMAGRLEADLETLKRENKIGDSV